MVGMVVREVLRKREARVGALEEREALRTLEVLEAAERVQEVAHKPEVAADRLEGFDAHGGGGGGGAERADAVVAGSGHSNIRPSVDRRRRTVGAERSRTGSSLEIGEDCMVGSHRRPVVRHSGSWTDCRSKAAALIGDRRTAFREIVGRIRTQGSYKMGSG